ncbi:hypothetical protein LCGC14_2287280, partial [marine sediment metagenome]
PLDSFAPKAQIIHIDIDPAEISKNVPAYLPIVGDAKNALKQLADLLPKAEHAEWIAYLGEVAEAHPLKGKMQGVTTPNILRILKKLVEDPILVTDVGRHQMYAAHYFPVEPNRSFITSGGLGTMGFSVPAAIGAKRGVPDKTVVDIVGDGSFMMTCQEIATAVEENITVLILIMNDYCLGMISQLQDSFYGKRHQACRFGRNVDFARLAEAMGALGLTVSADREIVPALEQALAGNRTSVIDFRLEEAANVYPMVTGASLLDYVE